MSKLIPKTIAGKVWVVFLLSAAVVQVNADYQFWGDPLGVAFLIDAFIRVVFYYAVFYSLPVSIYQRQRDYFKNKKSKNNLEEGNNYLPIVGFHWIYETREVSPLVDKIITILIYIIYIGVGLAIFYISYHYFLPN